MNSNKTNSEIEDFPQELQTCIENIINKEGYVSHKVVKRMITTEGGNYLGDLYEVDVKGETVDGNKETNLFIKKSISGETLDGFFSVSHAYKAETYFYTELSKIFTELQDDAAIPMKDRFKTVTSFEGTKDAVILENLTPRGFKTGYRMDVMSLKFAELSVQQLAKFHGLSFALEKLRADYFDNKIRKLKTPYDFNDQFVNVSKNIMDNITIENVDEETKKRVEAFVPIFIDKYPKYMSGEEFGINSICHGDFRSSNILTKEIDGELSEVVAVDYQLLHYGCPITDFLYLIINSSDQTFRKHHFTYLKYLYYDSLGTFLQYFDMDVEDIYPRKEFEINFKNRLDYALMVAIYIFPFNFVLEDDVPDVSKEDAEKLNFKLHSKFQERVKGIFDDFEMWNCL